MKRKTKYLFLLSIFVLLFITGCSAREKEINVGFIYSGNIADEGVYQAQDQAREGMIEYFNGAVQTVVKDSVGDDNLLTVVDDMNNLGTSLIFISDNANQELIQTAAITYPDIDFIVYNGTATADNIKNYASRTYEADYLAGLIAGKSTPNNLIGFLAPDYSSSSFVHINAFALGVSKANPEAIVEVDFTGVPVSRSRLNASISKLTFNGCDVISSCLDSNSALIDAASRGVKVIGTAASGIDSSENYLTALTIDFEDFYIEQVQNVLDGTFNNTRYVGTVSDDFVSLAEYSVSVNQEARDAVENAMEEIKKGNLAIFTGPIYDSFGNLIAQEGQVLSEADLNSMDYTISNVEVLN